MRDRAIQLIIGFGILTALVYILASIEPGRRPASSKQSAILNSTKAQDDRAKSSELVLNNYGINSPGNFIAVITLDKLKSLTNFDAKVDSLVKSPDVTFKYNTWARFLSHFTSKTIKIADVDPHVPVTRTNWQIYLTTTEGQSFVVEESNPGREFTSLFQRLKVGSYYQFPKAAFGAEK